MNRVLGILGLCLAAVAAAAATAQQDAIYAPCLQAEDVEGLAEAFRLAGWDEVTDADEVSGAIAAISQTAYAIAALPRRFETRPEAEDYAASAVGWMLRDDPVTSPVFQRDGIYAMALEISAYETPILQCSLSAADFPEAEDLLQANTPITGLTGGTSASAVTFATFTLEPETGTDFPQSVDIVRLEADPNALSVLTGRYGIIIFRRLTPNAN